MVNITKYVRMVEMNSSGKTEPNIPLDIFEDVYVDECQEKVGINPRVPACTPAKAQVEQDKDEPSMDDLTLHPEVQKSNRTTKKPDRYNGRAKVALIANRL